LFCSIFYSKSDQNKKLNQTVSRTSKAVGVAITSAKSAVTSWWSGWSNTKTDKTEAQTTKSAEEETPL
jgi:trehalose-6-phosphate synthase